jgi:hypothetical protein
MGCEDERLRERDGLRSIAGERRQTAREVLGKKHTVIKSTGFKPIE